MSTHGESVNDEDEISSGDSSEDGEEEEDHEEKQVKSKRTSKSGGRQKTWSIESERLFKRKTDWELHEICYYKGNQYKISLICSNVNPRQYVLSPTGSSANTETRTWKDMLTPQEFQTAAVAKDKWTAGGKNMRRSNNKLKCQSNKDFVCKIRQQIQQISDERVLAWGDSYSLQQNELALDNEGNIECRSCRLHLDTKGCNVRRHFTSYCHHYQQGLFSGENTHTLNPASITAQTKVHEAAHMVHIKLAYHSLKNPTLSDLQIVKLFDVSRTLFEPAIQQYRDLRWDTSSLQSTYLSFCFMFG